MPTFASPKTMVPQLSWQSNGLKIRVSPVRLLVVPRSGLRKQAAFFVATTSHKMWGLLAKNLEIPPQSIDAQRAILSPTQNPRHTFVRQGLSNYTFLTRCRNVQRLCLFDSPSAKITRKSQTTRIFYDFVKYFFVFDNLVVTKPAEPTSHIPKKRQTSRFVLFSSGGRTRTSGLRVMSPTSYQLLYPAMYRFALQR